MKSEERHELQTNDLAKVANQATAVYDRYQNQILWGVVVLLLIMAGWIYFTRSAQVARESSWSSVQAATNPNEYLDVAIQHPKSAAASVAKLQAGIAWLEAGVKAAFRDREQANTQLKDARKAFEEVLASGPEAATVREAAMYGLAQTLEAISGAETEAAVSAYQGLLKEYPDSLYKEIAEDRIRDLKKMGTQEFLAWYQKQNPKPPEQPKPQDGQGPGANVPAPKPGDPAAGLGLPAPPPASGTEGETTPEAKPETETSTPVEPAGPALPEPPAATGTPESKPPSTEPAPAENK